MHAKKECQTARGSLPGMTSIAVGESGDVHLEHSAPGSTCVVPTFTPEQNSEEA